MNPLDILFTAILVGLTFFGLLKGLTRIVLFVAAIIVGLMAARVLYARVGEMLVSITQQAALRHILAFVLVFLAVLVAFQMVGHGLQTLLKWTFTSWIDRLGGGVLGLVAGILVSNVVLVVASYFPTFTGAWLQSSVLTPRVATATAILSDLLPEGAWTQLSGLLERARELGGQIAP